MLRVIIKIAPLLLIAIWPTSVNSDVTTQQGYSIEPLSQSIFDPSQMSMELMALNGWLNENYTNLHPDTLKGLREHLYYIIDSRVKQIFSQTGRILPKEPDRLLANLLFWAETLGVYGGTLVYNAVKRTEDPPREPNLPLPPGFKLRLVDDLFELRSEEGQWSVRFPYYFMTFLIRNEIAYSGKQLQIVLISTGAAKHAVNDEWSQATLILFFSPNSNPAEFSEHIAASVGVSLGGGSQLEIFNLPVHKGLDNENRIYKELTYWQTPHGMMGVAYLGVDGTYQWNRPHFLDFIRAIESTD